MSDVVLEPELLAEARALAEAEGVTLDRLVNAALAARLRALRPERFFAERAARGDVARGKAVLAKAGRGQVPEAGDD